MRTSKLRFELLEDRRVPASVVIPESTFDPEAFGSQISAGLDYNIVGYAYAVNHNGFGLVAAGTGGLYGPDDGRARTSADDDETVFATDTRIEIASVSKIITTVAVLRLLESQGGDLNTLLGTPISTYLPADWTIGPNVNLITIRHLLTHTSGFVEGGPGDPANAIGVNFEGFGNNTLQNLRALVAAGLGAPTRSLPDGSPAYSRSYSNANFSLLAKMVPYMLPDDVRDYLDDVSLNDPGSADTVFGDLYSDYVAENVLAPSGIDNPTMDVTGDYPALGYVFATAESVAGSPQVDQTDVGGAFGWKLSAPELACFMNTVRHTNTVLSDDARELMNNDDFLLGWSPNSISNTDPYVLAPLQDAFGSYYQHNGAGNGFRSQIVMFPGDVEASLVMNSFPPNIPNRFAFMREAYQNAWSGLVIEGDDSDNDFVVRRNADDAGKIDIVVDDVVIASPAVDLLTSLQFRGLGGNDTFFIEDCPETLDLILDGGSGDDTFDFGNAGSVFESVNGNLTVLGGSGDDNLTINDPNGIGSDYSIRGIHNTEITYDGIIGASSYTEGKLFVYDTIETLTLDGNTDPNFIVVSEITSGMTVTLLAGFNDDTIQVSDLDSGVNVVIYGEGGNDTVEVWNIPNGSTVSVIGDQPFQPGGADTLALGHGDLGTVQGLVFYQGNGGTDLLVLDDTGAPVGRAIKFVTGSVDASDGFGGVSYSTQVEMVRLQAGAHDDDVNVESLDFRTDLDLHGNLGSDVFTISEVSHNVDLAQGDVTIHGENGYPRHQDPNSFGPVDKDRLYVFDDLNAAKGNYAIRQDGDFLHGRANKFAGADVAALNVFYDQIEYTELRAGTVGDQILVNGAPRFNEVAVFGGGGKDAIDVEWTPALTNPMYVNAGAGVDTVRVSPTGKTLGALHSPLVVNGGTGAAGEVDRLIVSDALSGNLAPYTLTSTVLSRVGSAGIQYTGLENLSVGLNSQANDIAVTSTAASTSVSIAGFGGDDRLTASNLASAVLFVGGAGVKDVARLVGTGGNDTIAVQGNALTLTGGSLVAAVEGLEVDGAGGMDRMVLRGKAGTDEAFVLRPATKANTGRVTRNPFGAVAYVSVEEMSAEGNVGDLDTLQVNGQTQLNAFFGGSQFDAFNINLDAAGTTVDPFLVLHNGKGETMLTLTEYANVGVPKVNGLLGADVFDVRVSAAGPHGRRVALDGGGQPLMLKGDSLRVHYVKDGATAALIPAAPKNGKITINYAGLLFGISYWDMEDVHLVPG